MPKIRSSIISEHLRRKVKVLSSVPADPPFVPSILAFTNRCYGCPNRPNQSPTTTLFKDTSLQRHIHTPYSKQPLLKPKVDRFNTRGRTIYNTFDCLSSDHRGYPSRLYTSHWKNACGKQKALPKETRVAHIVSDAGVMTTTYHDAHSMAINKLEMEGLFRHDAEDVDDILKQADRLFEMYIKME